MEVARSPLWFPDEAHSGKSTLLAVVSTGRTLRYEGGEKPPGATVFFFDPAAVQRHGQIN